MVKPGETTFPILACAQFQHFSADLLLDMGMSRAPNLCGYTHLLIMFGSLGSSCFSRLGLVDGLFVIVLQTGAFFNGYGLGIGS